MHKHNVLKGLRVAITGGTSGLGLALVRQLTAAGAKVAFVARTPENVAKVAAETGAFGIVGDVGDKNDIYPVALQVTSHLGGLDILINNASSLGPVPLSLLADTECEDLELALAVNLLGPFRLTKALLGALSSAARNRHGALVVNITSDAAVSAYPTWGAYGASKAALAHMTAIWEAELSGDDIWFLAIDPGDMATPMHMAAIPDADPTELKRPETSAGEIIERMAATFRAAGALEEVAS